uniref:Si:rp71-39b20.4 n=1 Tax=Latimeria chalumnae TaxID=7897 RepID=H3BCP8_LATCH
EKMKNLEKRRSSLFANLKLGDSGSFSQSTEEDEHAVPFALESSVKQWNSMQNMREAIQPGEGDSEEVRAVRTSAKEEGFIRVNVGGTVFLISCSAAMRYPKTRVGKLALYSDPLKKLELCDDFSVQTNEFFFDRDPIVFHYIFHFYKSSVLWIMDELCPRNFLEEIEYWGIPMKFSIRCCRMLLEEKQDEVKEDLKVQRDLQAELEPLETEEHFEGKCLGEYRKRIWNLVENPYSSIPAKIIAILASLFVLISIVVMALSTVEELQSKNSNGKPYMELVEVVCVAFFTAEYLLRLMSTADITKFLRSVINTVDLIAILPFYIQFAFEFSVEKGGDHYQEDIEKMENVGKVGKILKIIRLMRILRILKLARHSTGLKAFGFTLRQCYQQVCCLCLFITMGIFTFSALMHSVEHDVPGTNFTSIPDAWWWAAVSISTVGYGDTVPETLLGRFVAFGCISFGIILNGMPISILYNKFSDYYSKLKAHETTTNPKMRSEIQLRERALKKMSPCW